MGALIIKNRNHLLDDCDFVGVELEGFEPSSKRGANRLSTCLATV